MHTAIYNLTIYTSHMYQNHFCNVRILGWGEGPTLVYVSTILEFPPSLGWVMIGVKKNFCNMLIS